MLNEIKVSANNQYYDSRNNCNAIIEKATNKLVYGCNSTIIPDNVVGIADNAFYGCTGIKSITIPSSVKTIGNAAFVECNGLASVTIPSSVENMNGAFDRCPNLVEVTILHQSPINISRGTFSNPENATLIVPYGCKAVYETADYWKEFKEIVELPSPVIHFADINVKIICVKDWDTNGDGELSEAEAAAVTDLSKTFQGNTQITSFNELTKVSHPFDVI